jgi:hypothetical protein
MGRWRFRKSIGSKYLKLNISKNGYSITGGVPGAHVNIDLSGRRRRPYMSTWSIPGTGLSYREEFGGKPTRNSGQSNATAFIIGLMALVVLLWLIFG